MSVQNYRSTLRNITEERRSQNCVSWKFGLIPSRGERIFSSPEHPDRLWGPRGFLYSGHLGLFPGSKACGSWSWPFTCICCLRGVYRDNFTWEGWRRSAGLIVWKTGERVVLRTIKRRKTNWNVHILLTNFLLRHVIKRKTEGTRRWGRILKHLLADRKERRRC
jgi:hypothetical protein